MTSGNFIEVARDISITRTEEYKGYLHIELKGRCPKQLDTKESEYLECNIDLCTCSLTLLQAACDWESLTSLAERIAFEAGRLSYLAHLADVEGPYPFIPQGLRREKRHSTGGTGLGTGEPDRSGHREDKKPNTVLPPSLARAIVDIMEELDGKGKQKTRSGVHQPVLTLTAVAGGS